MANNNRQPVILLSGGGTGGSVTPLLPVAKELQLDYPTARFYFFGTENGPERELVSSFAGAPIEFRTLPGGKWRRYFSFQNFFDTFKVAVAFFKARRELGRLRPDVVISAGSFSSVPLVWAAASRKIPVVIHQQDVRPGLANRLMAPFARVISVTFEKSLGDYGPKAVWIGNPINHREILAAQAASTETRRRYSRGDKPLILVIGGGTGAQAINDLVAKSLPDLTMSAQIVHLTGKGKSVRAGDGGSGYQTFEFLPHEEVLKLLAASDLVISRAGLGVLTELSAFGQAAIIIPIPASHQEDNASWLAREMAAKVISQAELTPESFISEIKNLLSNQPERERLGLRLRKVIKKGAAESLAGLVEEILESRKANDKSND